jgi:hypothetical protein
MSNKLNLVYRGSEKHKNRPNKGVKGTLCPEWTHQTPSGSYANDPFQHDWSLTVAQQLFKDAMEDPHGRQRRYATQHGIAFEAKPTADGTWHGYPIPWENVPPSITNSWKEQGKVTRRQIRKNQRHADSDKNWALASGDES